MQVHILAIGAHPDDIELSCAGTLINEIRLGKSVAIVDLTEGELGTRGSVATRYEEAAAAAMVMGVRSRENLKMKDGFFENNEAHQRKLIAAIRKYRPSIVLANAPGDRHPDHGRAAQLIEESCFLSGLSKIVTHDEAGTPQARWRPAYVFHYIQDRYLEPDFVVDISESFAQKMKSIKAYSSQFHDPNNTSGEAQTYISAPEFLEGITSRARLMGKKIGVAYGEGFVSAKKIGINSFDAFIQNET
ncbi:MAG: bacillithiol biosynthesis deacetylase BshB1 [Bacteroidetes bacterium]|nr:bacillithiol biosynthesis deacetylase BshB1 [Bacteroidota bacterium]